MKRLFAVLLLFALLLCACETNVQVEESGEGALQTYQLPTEWMVTKYGEVQSYAVSYEGNTVTLTQDGEVLLSFTLDNAGNVIQREEADGSKLEALYDGDGRLTATLLRDADGTPQQRIEYDERGRVVREYTRRRHDKEILREFTYGEDGGLLTEAQYGDVQSCAYEYHANGELAAETGYLLNTLPYYRREYGEDGHLAWEISYDKEGKVSYRYEYDEEENFVAKYDGDGHLYVNDREETIYDENGRRTEYKYYNDDGTLYERYEYDYDEAGREVSWRHYYSDGTLSREVFRTYNQAGVETKSVMKNYSLTTGELLDSTETEYDEAGNQIRYTAYDGEGNFSSRTERAYEYICGAWHMTRQTAYDGEDSLWFWEEMTYDEKGNNTAELTYDADGSLSVRIENIYDERGNRTEHIRYDGQGKVFYREVSVWDEQNNLQEYTDYNGDGSVSVHTVWENSYAYDEAGRVVRYGNAAVSCRMTYTYESGSGLQRETARDGNGETIRSCETVRDNNGNPRIVQREDWDYESRFEYEWSPEGGLRSYVRYSRDKTEMIRLNASGYTACTLTEAQYRALLELLLEALDPSKTVYILSADLFM